MPIVVNTNSSATTASFNLSSANDALRKSLARLSSGKRIVSPSQGGRYPSGDRTGKRWNSKRQKGGRKGGIFYHFTGLTPV